MKIVLIILFLLYSSSLVDSGSTHRFKRAADFLSQLAEAIQKVGATLTGGLSLNDNSDKVPTPQDFGFCTTNPNNCQYMACLAENFKNSKAASNLKQGSIVITDPALRNAVLNDPTISREACDQASLNQAGCDNFKKLLGIVKVFDPDSLHTDDEPRDKRSAFNDYGNEPKSPGKPNQGGNGSPNGVGPNGNNGVGPNGNNGPSGPSGSGPTGALPIQGSRTTISPANKQRDCEAIKREVIAAQNKGRGKPSNGR